MPFDIDIIDQIGSALCGAAQTMTWLIVCRAVQGIGGGGIMQLVQITISDIVSLQEWVSVTNPGLFLILSIFQPRQVWWFHRCHLGHSKVRLTGQVLKGSNLIDFLSVIGPLIGGVRSPHLPKRSENWSFLCTLGFYRPYKLEVVSVRILFLIRISIDAYQVLLDQFVRLICISNVCAQIGSSLLRQTDWGLIWDTFILLLKFKPPSRKTIPWPSPRIWFRWAFRDCYRCHLPAYRFQLERNDM